MANMAIRLKHHLTLIPRASASGGLWQWESLSADLGVVLYYSEATTVILLWYCFILLNSQTDIYRSKLYMNERCVLYIFCICIVLFISLWPSQIQKKILQQLCVGPVFGPCQVTQEPNHIAVGTVAFLHHTFICRFVFFFPESKAGFGSARPKKEPFQEFVENLPLRGWAPK